MDARRLSELRAMADAKRASFVGECIEEIDRLKMANEALSAALLTMHRDMQARIDEARSEFK